MPHTTNPADTILPDILPHLFSYLDPKDLASAATVCKTWNQKIDSQDERFKRFNEDLNIIQAKNNLIKLTKQNRIRLRKLYYELCDNETPSYTSLLYLAVAVGDTSQAYYYLMRLFCQESYFIESQQAPKVFIDHMLMNEFTRHDFLNIINSKTKLTELINIAVKFSQYDFIKFLLSFNKYYYFKYDSKECTPLYYAAANNDLSTVQILYQAAVDSYETTVRVTSVYAAASTDIKWMNYWFCELNGEPDKNSAWFIAMQNKSTNVLQYFQALVDYSKLYFHSKHAETLLYYAVTTSNISTIDWLQTKYLNILKEIDLKFYQTLLLSAATDGNTALVNKLLNLTNTIELKLISKKYFQSIINKNTANINGNILGILWEKFQARKTAAYKLEVSELPDILQLKNLLAKDMGNNLYLTDSVCKQLQTQLDSPQAINEFKELSPDFKLYMERKNSKSTPALSEATHKSYAEQLNSYLKNRNMFFKIKDVVFPGDIKARKQDIEELNNLFGSGNKRDILNKIHDMRAKYKKSFFEPYQKHNLRQLLTQLTKEIEPKSIQTLVL